MDDDIDELNNFLGNDFYDEDSPSEEQEVEPSDDNVLNSLIEKENKEAVKKRVKSRNNDHVFWSQPKLDEAMITGPKGVQALREAFKNYKPDRAKDPYENLSVVLKKYEHWAHVMFPKLKFEDVVSRCESLGDKRIVKVYMTKSRLDMPLTDEDFMPRKKPGDQIIETENNEENGEEGLHYDYQETNGAQRSPFTPNPREQDDKSMDATNEASRGALELEQRRREEAELELADQIMDDFDVY